MVVTHFCAVEAQDYKNKTRIFQRLTLNLLSSLFVAETVSILKPLFLLLIPLVTPFQLSERVEEVFYKNHKDTGAETTYDGQ